MTENPEIIFELPDKQDRKKEELLVIVFLKKYIFMIYLFVLILLHFL